VKRDIFRMLFALVLVLSFSLIPAAPATAATLTGVSATTDNSTAGATANYTIEFTTATTGNITTIIMAFDPGFDVSGAILGTVSGIGPGSITVSGDNITYTVSSPVDVADGVSVSIGSSNITNPSNSGSYNITITTKNDLGAEIDSGAASVTINPGPVDHFSVVTENAGTEVAGTAFSVNVTAQDQYNNTATSYNGTAVSITFTSTATAAPSGNSTTIPSPQPLNFSTTPGVATATGFILVNAGETPTITASDGTYNGTSDGITVNPAAFAGYTVVPASTNQVAGAAFTANITAVDEFQNISPSGIDDATLNTYTFTFSGPANAPDSTAPTYPTTANFTSGVWAPSVTLVKAETAALVVTDNQSAPMSGTSADITVAPSGADSLGVTGITDPIIRGTPSNVTVTAYDSYRNVATSYNGTVTFTSTDAAAALPSDYAFVPATDNGTHTFTNGVTFNTVGEQSVTATDNSTGTITGTRSGITVYIIEDAGSYAPPTYYTSTSLFGASGRFRTDRYGKLLESLDATSVDGMLTIAIPKGTIALTKSSSRLSSLNASTDESPPSLPEDTHVIGLAYDFGPDGATFDPAITLTWKYDPDALPEGVAEDDLVIAYYDEDAGEWVELDSEVDTENNTITTSVSHFTTFTIIGTAKIAAFTLTLADISPTEVAPGEEVTITVSVANTGTKEGSYTVVLEINDIKEEEKDVTVAAGASEEVAFTVVKDKSGEYSITVDGLVGTFTVMAPPAPPAAPAPATFSLSKLFVNPAEVKPNEPVTISVSVANIGGTEGNYDVVLKVNGIKEAEQSVTVAAGKSRDISFAITREQVGSYTVEADGLSGSFTVVEAARAKATARVAYYCRDYNRCDRSWTGYFLFAQKERRVVGSLF